jgi:uncharacterized protein
VKIDLANMAGVPGAHGRYVVDETLPATDGVEVVGPVTGEITVQNTGQLLVVRGRLGARVRSSCRRCLAETEEPLQIEIAEEFAAEGAAADVDTVDREDPERSAIHDYVLEVSEFVRQQVAVHLPMASLCRADCQGLCPQCGRNLNQGQCGCEPDLGAGPFAKLKEMLEKKAGRE